MSLKHLNRLRPEHWCFQLGKLVIILFLIALDLVSVAGRSDDRPDANLSILSRGCKIFPISGKDERPYSFPSIMTFFGSDYRTCYILIRRTQYTISTLEFLRDENPVEYLFLLIVRANFEVFWWPRESRNETYRLCSGVGVHTVVLGLRYIVFSVGKPVLLLARDYATEEGYTFSVVEGKQIKVSEQIVLVRRTSAGLSIKEHAHVTVQDGKRSSPDLNRTRKTGMHCQLTSSSSRKVSGVAPNPVGLSPALLHCNCRCHRPPPRKALSLAASKEWIFGYACA